MSLGSGSSTTTAWNEEQLRTVGAHWSEELGKTWSYQVHVQPLFQSTISFSASVSVVVDETYKLDPSLHMLADPNAGAVI
jgi:hypothetical protein